MDMDVDDKDIKDIIKIVIPVSVSLLFANHFDLIKNLIYDNYSTNIGRSMGIIIASILLLCILFLLILITILLIKFYYIVFYWIFKVMRTKE